MRKTDILGLYAADEEQAIEIAKEASAYINRANVKIEKVWLRNKKDNIYSVLTSYEDQVKDIPKSLTLEN